MNGPGRYVQFSISYSCKNKGPFYRQALRRLIRQSLSYRATFVAGYFSCYQVLIINLFSDLSLRVL